MTNLILNRLFCKAELLELELEEPELEPSEEPPMLELEPLGLAGAEDKQNVGARLTMRSDYRCSNSNLVSNLNFKRTFSARSLRSQSLRPARVVRAT